ncbi:protein of unknown function [Hyphomicrobium sp. 1Nfss2.1]
MELAPIYGGLLGFGLGIALMIFGKRHAADVWHAERHPLATRVVDVIELAIFTVFCAGLGYGLQKAGLWLNW